MVADSHVAVATKKKHTHTHIYKYTIKFLTYKKIMTEVTHKTTNSGIQGIGEILP
jgi:hypothetical protein